MPLGDLAKAVFYLLALGGRIGVIGQVTNILQNASSAAQRVCEVLRDDPRMASAPGGHRGPVGGAVRFDAVGFVHASEPSLRVESETPPSAPAGEAKKPARTVALDGVSFEVRAGETVAVVGPTGAGKSTLLSLVARYQEATAGTVSVDGVDVRAWDRTALRRGVAVVFQETFLFSATVAENIAFGRPDAPREDVERVARAARADGFIRELAKGYDTVIGERGVSLSGGQRQRIAIARALLTDPRIVLLDDATSAIDPRTEHEIQEAMAELCRGRTTFVVAHRLSTVRRADRILLLDGGRLVASGTHASLMSESALYRTLFAAQTVEGEAA
jgi:ABC-type multidrug transport system fused ATPase/permease subunit